MMIKDLNTQLANVKELKRKKQKWENQLADYQKELNDKRKVVAECEEKLRKENHDIEKLSRFSLTNLFTTIAGTKEDRMRTEKRELVATQLKYDEARKATTHMEEAIAQIQGKLDEMADIDRQYNEILSEKEKLIKDSHSPLTYELFTLSEQHADLRSHLTEMQEAIDAGEEVLDALDNAIDELNKAENWGTWDMFGGGMITTAIKHGHIDDAKEAIHVVQIKMRTFQRELLDVDQTEEWGIDMTGLLTFADYFFDGLITDWFVQGKIKDSLKQAEKQRGEIKQLVLQLKRGYEKKESELAKVETKQRNLLENSTV